MTDIKQAAPEAVSIPAEVAHAFADTRCGALTENVAPALNCAELDALAGLLRALGAEQAADEWTAAHAEADSVGDDHFRGTVPAAVSFDCDAHRWRP
ncbi:hypothetical protein ACFY1J_31045 [Streptomyces sp. NPDC001406]|uniref:hypothetical protein n=1 Tax=Streptomyces sp. NPDC001406 TaxID=3364572 RepID=UPI0036C4CB0F